MPAETFKQKTLQTALSIPGGLRVCAILCCSCTAATAAGALANPASSDTVPKSLGDAVATMRLIGGATRDGSYVAGIDISMSKGSHTYWEQPGEAGVPPVFAFNGSKNVAKAVVKFPVPSRITEEGLEAFGYTGKVVFPVVVTPTDRSKPVTLHADVSYAVCNKICVPAHGDANLTLLPGGGGGETASLATEALADVPLPMTDAQRKELTITAKPGPVQPTWTLKWSGRKAVADIFPQAPAGFFFTTRRIGPDTWTLTADQTVLDTSSKRVPVSLTLKQRSAGLFVTIDLDVRAGSE